jgi:hypothetical protein
MHTLVLLFEKGQTVYPENMGGRNSSLFFVALNHLEKRRLCVFPD